MLKKILRILGIIIVCFGLIWVVTAVTVKPVFLPSIVLGIMTIVFGLYIIWKNRGNYTPSPNTSTNKEDVNVDKLIKENITLKKQVESLKSKLSPANLAVVNLDETTRSIIELTAEKKKLEGEIIELNNEVTMQSFGLYTPMYSAMESPRIKQLLLKNREDQKESIKNDTACDYYNAWTVNGSKHEGKRMTKNNVKQILRSFNSECDSIIDKVRFNNYTAVAERIYKSANQLNNMNTVNKISITDKYIELKQNELRLVHEYALKVEEEKEAARQERAEMREQKKAEAELKAARESLLKEEKHFNSAVTDLKRNIEMCTNDAAKERYEARLAELEKTLDEIHKKQADIDYRQANQKAGYVYVISNVGSFGPDVYKIGVTRRLDPYERVQELSSASVPFKFDVHAMIFSPDAYGLETELHRIFDQGKLNKVNTRREFFHAKLEDIENVIKEKFSATFEMKYEADAEEWRISKKISEGELNESEIIKSDEDIANEDEGEIIA